MNGLFPLYKDRYIPFSFDKENYERDEDGRDINYDYIMEVLHEIMNGYAKILLILFNPSLAGYLIG
ncbi:hypothetical protein HERIO_1955 [Hepatospora eriocheir]|uniref:Uncharacterized protein n=1 Tax=Hepatospora eriocheir TaxID=1081669 RepID=A0A1X0Q8J4_9MICR|nr:hypothetical protein HERIO_1955 [Hepatospora eriocheir]